MRLIPILILAALFNLPAKAANPIPPLQQLAPFTGTWTQVIAASAKGNPDVQRWEWAFKGKVVRIIHGSGDYGGESLIHWDAQQKKIIFRYVTNAGFYTDGVMTPTQEGFDVHEFVRGSKSGPSEVATKYSITADGTMKVIGKFKMAGKWAEEFTSVYKRTPDAEVKYTN